MSIDETVIETVNPATGEALASYPVMDDAAIEDVLTEVTEAGRTWAAVGVADRSALLARVADTLDAQRDSVAALITSEMGKPLREARGEVDKSASTARWYAENLQRLLAPKPVDVGDTANAWVTREPIGPVLAIMPWNFPLWQVMRFVLPAVGAGNTVLLKHSPNVTGSALAIESLLLDAGVPQGVLRVLVVDEARVAGVSQRLIADPRVAGVTLTGSNRAGAAVGAAAGRAVKPSVLELGGSDAFVVLSDADVAAAADAAVRARFHNAGQSCVCAKRFVVAADVADAFLERFLLGVSALQVGDPTDESVDVGPMARDDLRTAIQRQVDESVAAGARLVAGGSTIEGDGWFFEPTVLTVDGPGVPAFDEETFGPLAAVVVAKDDDDAARLAGATAYGLGLSVWSASTERAVELAARVTTGAVFINSVVASDVRVPFGGTKQSGYGRELSAEGMYAFMNQRTYWAAI
ncbi:MULTISPECIES: aldehyde dehydrogenase family protein [unclassified Knoellia]|uniref:aldehyde dehydrogenase family protein n=1 Tax=Knoellia altitudinis TaxID=3404795 RepID=UPI00361E2B28